MPYKSRRNRAKYQKRYRKHKQQQLEAVRKALDRGNVTRAKHLLNKKPNIHIKKKKRGK